jgi:hypothetical protein
MNALRVIRKGRFAAKGRISGTGAITSKFHGNQYPMSLNISEVVVPVPEIPFRALIWLT